MNRSFFIAVVALCACAAIVRAEIKSGDSLFIYIRGVPAAEKPKIEGRYVVGKSGTIRLPLADVAVTARGLTAESLARRIEAVYREEEIYARPSIEVLTKDIPKTAEAVEAEVGRDVGN